MRLSSAREELAKIAPYFPNAVAGLTPIITDAFLVHTDYHGLCRFFVVTLNGRNRLTYSRAPEIVRRVDAR